MLVPYNILVILIGEEGAGLLICLYSVVYKNLYGVVILRAAGSGLLAVFYFLYLVSIYALP